MSLNVWTTCWLRNGLGRRGRGERRRARRLGVERLEPRSVPAVVTYASGPINLTIPDNNPAGTVATINVPVAFGIADVNVNLTITHPNDADLDVYLRSPTGTRVKLFDDIGSTGDDFTDTTIDDEAFVRIAQASVASPPYTGSFRGEEPLSTFVGQGAQGNWRLELADDTAGNVGVLRNWSLTFKQGVRYTSSDRAGAIPGVGSITSSLNVGVAFPVEDLNVVVNFYHPRANQVRMTLTTPSGQTVRLADDVTDDAPYSTTVTGRNPTSIVFNDDAERAIDEFATTNFQNSFSPVEPLSNFRLTNAGGTWLLTIEDLSGPLDFGDFLDWSLVFETSPDPVVEIDLDTPRDDGGDFPQVSWGETFDVGYFVENIGSGDLPEGSEFRLYLSPDAVIDENDYFLGSESIPYIVGSSSSGGSGGIGVVTVTLPGSPPPGFTGPDNVFIGAIVDPQNRVVETGVGEANNRNRGVGVDIVRLAITRPDEAESNDTPATATPVAPAARYDGRIGTVQDVDWYSFEVSEPGLLRAVVTAAGGLDPRLRLYGPDGRLLIQSDQQAEGADGTAAAEQYIVPADNRQVVTPLRYYAAVSSQGGTGDYRLDLLFSAARQPVEPILTPAASGSSNFRYTGDLVDFGFTPDGVADAVALVDVGVPREGGGTRTVSRVLVLPGTAGVAAGQGGGSFGDPVVAMTADAVIQDVVYTGGQFVALLRDGRIQTQFSGTFRIDTLVTGPFDGRQLYAADLSGDGADDLVVLDPAADRVVVLLKTSTGFGSPEAARAYQLPSPPAELTFADVDGDRDLDILTANLGEAPATGGSVTVLRNARNVRDEATGVVTESVLTRLRASSFATTTFATGTPGANSLAVGDLDADGFLDVVTTDRGSRTGEPAAAASTLTVLWGSPGGVFALDPGRSKLTAGQVPVDVAVIDVNGDDMPDIVSADQNDNSLSVILNDGGRQFQARREVATGRRPIRLAEANTPTRDVNGDGLLDLVVFNGQISPSIPDTLTVVLGNGDGSFRTRPFFATGDNPVFALSEDVSGDGVADVITTNKGFSRDGVPLGSVTVLLADGVGGFRPAIPIAGLAEPLGAAVGDVNEDGRPDLVVANGRAGTVSVLFGLGQGLFATPVAVPAAGRVTAVALDFLDGDGFLDLVVTEDAGAGFTGDAADTYNPGRVRVFHGNGNGTFRLLGTYQTGIDPRSLTVADLDGDGDKDIVAANHFSAPSDAPQQVRSSVTVLRNLGRGVFAPGETYTTEDTASRRGRNPTSLVAADVTGDGLLDLGLASLDTNNGVILLLGRADGAFADPTFIKLPQEPRNLTAANVDGDARMEFVTADEDGTATVFHFQADGTVERLQVFAADGGPGYVAVRDVSGDGRNDLVLLAFTDNEVRVQFGDGNGDFSGQGVADTLGLRQVPQYRDFNADGVADVATLGRDGVVRVSLGRRDAPGQFGAAIEVNRGRPARDVAAFTTADGRVALAVTDQQPGTTSQLSFYRFQGGRFVRTNGIALDGRQANRVAARDLDGDGDDDLVTTNVGDNTVSVVLQTGFTANRFAGTVRTLAVGLSPSDIAFADLGGDPAGRPEILVTNQVSGDVSVLVNDGRGGFRLDDVGRFRAGATPFGVVSARLTVDATLDADGDTVAGDVRGGTYAGVAGLLQSSSLAAGRFAGSGAADAVVVNRATHTLQVLRGNGAGGFVNALAADTTTTSFLPERLINDRPTTVAAGRLDGDAWDDVAVLMQDRGEVWVYLNNSGDGTFRLASRVDVGTDATGFVLAHVTRPGGGAADGLLDLVVGTQFGDVQVLVGTGGGRFAEFRPRGGSSVSIDVANLDGDRRDDMALGNEAGDRVSVNRSGGNSQLFTTANGVQAPRGGRLVDVNGDRRLDLVVANSTANNVQVYLAGPGGQFAAPLTFRVGTLPETPTVADVTGDGIMDLVVPNRGSNDVSILPGTGTRSAGGSVAGWSADPSRDPRLRSGGTAPTEVMVVANPANPGVPNLVVTNSGSNTVTALVGRGNGFFDDRNPVTLATGADPQDMIAGPRGPGGAAPVMGTVNRGSNDVTLFTYNPVTNTFTGLGRVATGGLAPTSGVAGDFNGDGVTDLLVGNTGSSTVSLLVGQSGGGFLDPRTVFLSGGVSEIALSAFQGNASTLVGFASFLQADGTEAAARFAFDFTDPVSPPTPTPDDDGGGGPGVPVVPGVVGAAPLPPDDAGGESSPTFGNPQGGGTPGMVNGPAFVLISTLLFEAEAEADPEAAGGDDGAVAVGFAVDEDGEATSTDSGTDEEEEPEADEPPPEEELTEEELIERALERYLLDLPEDDPRWRADFGADGDLGGPLDAPPAPPADDAADAEARSRPAGEPMWQPVALEAGPVGVQLLAAEEGDPATGDVVVVSGPRTALAKGLGMELLAGAVAAAGLWSAVWVGRGRRRDDDGLGPA